ncbi:OsmC family protein [Actinotalea solisilvae]|uniref:OsmC family protein n=1 Tax=Actinotalea solisilvae TaxID=2072922 RepID=UPI0018F1F09E|nr:OsmC family protein [Actinotalea solisilvae]
MADDPHRSVHVARVEAGVYVARNVRGGELRISSSGGSTFTPVELLLAAIGACTAVDVDTVTSRRAEPDRFEVRVDAAKVRDEGGNLLRDLVVTFDLAFPEGEAGDAARSVVARAVQVSHDRTCTVSRTVEAGTPVEVRLA